MYSILQFIGAIREGQTRTGVGRKRAEGRIITRPPPRMKNSYIVTSFTCVAKYQVFPNGSVTAELRSP